MVALDLLQVAFECLLGARLFLPWRCSRGCSFGFRADFKPQQAQRPCAGRWVLPAPEREIPAPAVRETRRTSAGRAWRIQFSLVRGDRPACRNWCVSSIQVADSSAYWA